MTHWLRQLFDRPPAPAAKPPRTSLGLQRLEDREVPATFNVSTTADSGAGSLRDAVAQANSTAGADSITFQAGLGAVTLTTAQLSLTDTTGATTISGPSGGTQVVQRSTAGGTPNFRILAVNSGVTAAFNNLTISNGNTTGSAGGIENRGTLTVTNSTVSGNTASNFAGGIDNPGGTLTLTNSTISGNSAGSQAGGISSNNSLTVRNSTISGNTSNGPAGGISVDSGTATLTNVTVTGNRSDNNNSGAETGGGLFRQFSPTVTLNNTLVAGNFRGTGSTRDDVSGAVAAASANNLIGDGTNLTGITNGTGGNLIGTGGSPINPLLGTLGTYGGLTQVYPLLAGSPAINAGSNSAASGLTADGRGSPFVRSSGGTVDIGAFEVQATPVFLVVSSTGDADDDNFAAGQLTLREAVRLSANPGDDAITFAPSLAGATITLGSQLTLTTAITISGGTTGVTISGGNATRLFNIDDSTGTQQAVALSGLRLIGGNGSGGEGGAVFNQENLTLANCTLTNNSSPSFGGAIRNHNSGTLTIDNSTLASNTAMGSGGAIYTSGTLSVRNSTLTANRSDSDNSGGQAGGGIATFNGSGSTTTLRNTIVFGNFQGSGTTANDLGEKNVQSPASINNLIGTGAGGLTNGTNGNQVGVNPLLGTLGTYGGSTQLFPLLAGSPAINAGSNTAASGLTTDQRGFVRVIGTVDIGAFEVQPLLVVDNTGDADDGNFAAGQLTLREAVRLSNSNPGADTITFQAGLAAVTLTTAQLSLTDTTGATTISGPSGGTQVVQRSTAGGTPNFRILAVNSGVTANLNNLTVSNGNGSDGSGGGGILNYGTLTVSNSTVSGNTTSSLGGGIYSLGGTLTLTNCTVSGNTASGSGGIYSHSTLVVTNSTVSGNTVSGFGGGIFVGGGTATLTNVTITGNRSDNNNSGGETGGGLYHNSGTTTLNNTLIAGNFRGTGTTRDDVAGTVVGTSANNLIGDGTNLSGITNGSGGNQIGTSGSPINPLLQPLNTNGGPTRTHALGQNSPAINAGSNTAASGLTTDQRGFVRIIGAVDIGAFEVQPLLVVDNTGDADDGNFAAGQLTLREAVRLSNSNPGADTITFAAGLGDVVLTTNQLTLSDTTGATTISGPSGGTQVVQRSTAGGTPNFRIFGVNGGVTANFNNLTISNGISGDEGGIVTRGTLTLTNCTVSGNTATSNVGGISNLGGTLTLTNCTVSGNTSAASGGGIYSNSTLVVTNSTISGNTNASNGGGIFVAGGTATLTNVTVTGNRSDINNSGGETGGGLFRGSETVTLNNTLVAGNFRGTGTTRDDVSGAVAAASANNLIGDGTNLTGITNGSGGNLIGTAGSPINPLLQPLNNNGGPTRTHALGQNSPALGKASASVANYSVYDQRGTARDLGAADIGAYEVQHPLAPVGVPTTNATLFAPKPSATANEAFVKGLYQATLLRAPDAGGMATWLNHLANGMTRDTVANGFVNSTENRQNQVTFNYRYFLGREPDTGGLNHWVGRLQGGEDEGSVMTGFILSAEFSGSNTDAQFVNLMYYALLGRQAETAGFNDWMTHLSNGMSRATVVQNFLRSDEGLNRVVRSLFQAYLKRDADAGAITTFRTALLSGTTFGQAATSILGGTEFFNNAAANMS